MLLPTLVNIVALSAVSSAHFILHWPPTAGFDDDEQPTGPCGGADVVVNASAPQVQVDRFAVQIQNTHPAGSWQFRATLSTEEPYNFTDIVPVVNTTGVGDFCLSYMSVPSEFAGRSGILQVVDYSVDGTLYQCAPVNFVTGANNTLGGACSNSSSEFTATWGGVAASSESGSSSSASGSSTGTMSMATSTASVSESGSAGAASTTSSAAAVTMAAGSVIGGLGLLAGVLAL